MEQMSRNIGFQLKKIRQQRSYSLDDVAKVSGVSKAQLAQIEKGESNPTVSTIWKIAGEFFLVESLYFDSFAPSLLTPYCLI